MRILVTGAGGFLGFHIAKLLKSKGHEVFNFSRTHHKKLDAINVTTITGDLRNLNDVESALKNIDAIFHVAALAGIWGSYDEYYSINFLGTKNLVESAKKNNIKKFVYTSTPSVVFADKDIIGANETLSYPETFYTHYAHTKCMAEKLVLSSHGENFKTCALRPHLIWGPGDPHILPRLRKKSFERKLKIVGSGDNFVDVIYVENAAHAHVQAFLALDEKAEVSGQAYFIGQEGPVNLWWFINELLKASDAPIAKHRIPYWFTYLIGGLFEKIYHFFKISGEPPMTRFVAMQLAKSHYFSHEKAKKDFNYQPLVTIDEGLTKIRESFSRSH